MKKKKTLKISPTKKNNQPTAHLAVRVNVLRHDAPVLVYVDHGERGPAAVAALIPLGVARDQLLLRERDQLVVRKEPGALEAASGAERPARAAVRLVHTRRRVASMSGEVS